MNKHKKAIKVTLLTLLVSAVPLAYLGWMHHKNIVLDVTEFGVVPDFALMFHNNPKGMTHVDTEHHSTVIVATKDSCAQGCPQLVETMTWIKNYYKENLKGDVSDPNTPMAVRFIIQADSGLSHLPSDWDQAIMDENTPLLVPDVKKDGEFPAFVLIDDGSFYRGFVPLSDPQLKEKLTRELTRMTSSQFLMHYVTKQTLMWKKVKGRNLEKQ